MSPELSPDLGSSNVPVHRFAPDLLTSRLFPLVRRCPADVPQCPPSRGGQRRETGLTSQCPRGKEHCGHCREKQWTTRGHWRERTEQAADNVAGHSDPPWGDSARCREQVSASPDAGASPSPSNRTPQAHKEGTSVRPATPDGWHSLMKPPRRKERPWLSCCRSTSATLVRSATRRPTPTPTSRPAPAPNRAYCGRSGSRTLTDQCAGGICLFTDEASAHAYVDMHTKRLEGFGVTGIRAKFFDVNQTLTSVTRGPIS